LTSTVYQWDLLIGGVPARSPTHGAFGWSSVGLLRGPGETILLDTGGQQYRELLLRKLARLGIGPGAITVVALTHCHWDHMSNYPMFANARVLVSATELRWAASLAAGHPYVPELHVRALIADERLVAVRDGQEVAPGLWAVATPGHTPGHTSYFAETTAGRLVFTGDALKDERELLTRSAVMTLDPTLSRRSIEHLATISSVDNATLVCGHDRLLAVRAGRIEHRSAISAEISMLDVADPTQDRMIALPFDR
jgi:glyoxylase-like metal-dependent hydrolase (beta-lactamase superfamily II)